MEKDRKHEDSVPIKDALEGYFKALGISDKVNETRVLSQWEELMGKAIAVRTSNKRIKDKILYLDINSSVMRDELQQRKAEIIKKINDFAGSELISDIFLK